MNRFKMIVFLMLLICLPLGAVAVDLNSHLWRERLLFLVAPSADDAMAVQQRDALNKRTDALNDRDLKVVQLYEHSPSLFDDKPLSDREAQDLHSRLRTEPEARELILIGKDGSIKRRASIGIALREIFMQIDEMPMRREELQEKIQAGQPVTLP